MLCFVNGALDAGINAVGCDKEAIRVDIAWNTAVKPAQVAEALQSACRRPCGRHYRGAQRNQHWRDEPRWRNRPGRAQLSPETLVMVDAVSSAGVLPFPSTPGI